MSKSDEFIKYVEQNPYRFIGWMNDEVTIKFFDMIGENAEEYTQMLKYQPIENTANIVKFQTSVQILETLKRKIDGLFKDITEPEREELEDEYDDKQE